MGRGEGPGKLTLKGHTGVVLERGLQPGREADRLLAASDKTVKVWDAATRPGNPHAQGAHRSRSSVAFSPDGKRIVSGSGDDRR